MPNHTFVKCLGLLMLIVGISVGAPLFAQDVEEESPVEECPALTINADSPQQSRLRELYRNQDVCVNERVEIEGTVEQYVEDPAVTTGFYYLSDQFGVWIKVRTPDIESLPELNTRHRVSGVVGYNRVRIDRQAEDWRTAFPEAVRDLLAVERGGIYVSEPFLSEDGATTRCPDGALPNADGACPPPPCPDGSVRNSDGSCPTPPSNLLLWVGIGAAILVLIGLGFALVRTLSSKPGGSTGTTSRMPSSPTPTRTPLAPPTSTGGQPAQSPSQVVEGKTIKMHRPADDKTVKVLPGRFKVTGGLDDISEVRFFAPSGRSTAEITFGRAEGRPYEHIQLKPKTVSSRQAKIVFDGGKYTLHNFASSDSNPTTHNGRSMGQGETIELNDGDRISMGEVEFIYAAS